MVSTEQDRLFQENAGRTARLLVYGVIALVMMAADQRGHYLQQLRDFSAHLLIPVYEVIALPFDGMARAGDYFTRQHSLQQELTALQQENLRLTTQAQVLTNLREENNRLRELLGASPQGELDVVFCELVRIDLDPYSHRVIINRGSRHGIATGQPVVDAHGVFGQVERVSAGGAQVILISDPDHALPVQINRTGLRTLAYGSGHPQQLILPDLPLNTDVMAGDLIVTSGLGGRFIAGLPVAEVVSTEVTAQGDFTRAIARPLAGLNRSSSLLVITTPAANDTAGP
ncbi:MAG: rod shape-determining protein MreC [Wenzhouxiangellaceae bacterium]